ncbi:MAG: hypothetical protein K2X27_23355 [Candidatus Obscuribacterales bacterium]|nr:hypothetical protein [Candidatus Obscuribacterales bacterium]
MAKKREREFFKLASDENQIGLTAMNNSMKALEESEIKLLSLEIRGKRYAPTSFYLAPKISNGFECSMIFADDTIHTCEGTSFTTVPMRSGDKIKVLSAWSFADCESFRFYSGNPGEMHNSGYKKVSEVRFDPKTGLLDYKFTTHNHELLFALIKVRSDAFFRKFVFVISPELN